MHNYSTLSRDAAAVPPHPTHTQTTVQAYYKSYAPDEYMKLRAQNANSSTTHSFGPYPVTGDHFLSTTQANHGHPGADKYAVPGPRQRAIGAAASELPPSGVPGLATLDGSAARGLGGASPYVNPYDLNQLIRDSRPTTASTEGLGNGSTRRRMGLDTAGAGAFKPYDPEAYRRVAAPTRGVDGLSPSRLSRSLGGSVGRCSAGVGGGAAASRQPLVSYSAAPPSPGGLGRPAQRPHLPMIVTNTTYQAAFKGYDPVEFRKRAVDFSADKAARDSVVAERMTLSRGLKYAEYHPKAEIVFK
jgi:hypothetical protein